MNGGTADAREPRADGVASLGVSGLSRFFFRVRPMATLPRPGAAVSVLEFGRWLNGVVVEASAASGEFLVDYDDEAEVAGWVSASQPWRLLGPDIAAEPENAGIDVTPALPPAPPVAAKQPSPPPLIEPAPPPSDEVSGGWDSAVEEQFARLHATAVSTDGRGPESPTATRERFDRLHSSLALDDET